MQEKIITFVPASAQALCQKGCAALNQGDFDNAIAIFNEALDAEPGFVECREVLRRAQWLRAQKNRGFLKRALEEVREFPELLEAETYLRSQPLKAIRIAEHVLNHIPNNILAHKILARAALGADMPRTALLSLDFIYYHVAEHLAITLELVDALTRAGRIREAIAVCGRLQKDYPDNHRVSRALGRLSKLAFDTRTNEIAKAAAAEYFSRLRTTNPSFVRNLGVRRNGSVANTRREGVWEKNL
ncbi:MAG TPA: tetratricopeptide repeat protein [Candidatus Acidoferrales bacterium]|nr:tetratricopeptide repeat protein [Candidatus Acidoferrales bacterium]